MTHPKRIQLSRRKGWRKPKGAVVVSRPLRWGNPYRVVEVDDVWPWRVRHHVYGVVVSQHATKELARAAAVDAFRRDTGPHPIWLAAAVRELAGRDLACWCPLDQPCHADVLLELANGGAS